MLLVTVHKLKNWTNEFGVLESWRTLLSGEKLRSLADQDDWVNSSEPDGLMQEAYQMRYMQNILRHESGTIK